MAARKLTKEESAAKRTDKRDTDKKSSSSSSTTSRTTTSTVTEQTGDFGTSQYTGNKITKKITITSRPTGKSSITYSRRGSSKRYRNKSDAIKGINAIGEPQTERASATVTERPLARRLNTSTTSTNIFTQNPDVVKAEQERAKQEAELQEGLTRYSDISSNTATVKEKSTWQKIQQQNREGNRRLADAGKVVTSKTKDFFSKKDEKGRVIIKDKAGNVIGSRTTVATETDKALVRAKSGGQVAQTIATDLLVDPVTLVTAPISAAGAWIKGGQLIKGGTAGVKAANAVKAARAAEAAAKVQKVSKIPKIVGYTADVGRATPRIALNIANIQQATRAGFQTSDELILQSEAKDKGVDVNRIRRETAEARNLGFQQSRESISGQAWYKQIAANVNVGFGDRRAYQEGAQFSLQDTDLTQKEKEAVFGAANRQRSGRAVVQLGSDIVASTQAERIGRSTVANIFETAGQTQVRTANRAALKVAGRAALGTAPAGFFEGATNELTQQEAEGRKSNLKDAAVMGGFGAASSSVISSVISGGQTAKALKGKTGVRAIDVVNVGTWLIDPLEPVGDVAATGIQKAGTKLTGKIPKTAVVTGSTGAFVLQAQSGVTQEAQNLAFGEQPKAKGKGKPKQPFNPLDNTRNMFSGIFGGKTQTQTQNNQPKRPRSIFGTFLPTQTNVRTGTQTRTRTNPSIPTPPSFSDPFGTNPRPQPTKRGDGTTVPQPIQQPQQQQQQTATQPNVPTQAVVSNVNVNVPTSTVQPRFFPPIPPPLSLGGYSGVGAARGGRKKFVNELDYTLNSILGTKNVNVIPKAPKQRRRPTRRRRK